MDLLVSGAKSEQLRDTRQCVVKKKLIREIWAWWKRYFIMMYEILCIGFITGKERLLFVCSKEQDGQKGEQITSRR